MSLVKRVVDPSTPISIEIATVENRPLLGRLMQVYLSELSELDKLELNSDGSYKYEYFDHYWREGDRFPFLFYVHGEVAGFVLVNSHSLINKELNSKSIAEFFVLSEYRKKDIGRSVAFRIFDLFPGNWQVGEMANNESAQKFWRKVIAEYTKGEFDEVVLDDDNWQGPVQSFNNSTGSH